MRRCTFHFETSPPSGVLVDLRSVFSSPSLPLPLGEESCCIAEVDVPRRSVGSFAALAPALASASASMLAGEATERPAHFPSIAAFCCVVHERLRVGMRKPGDLLRGHPSASDVLGRRSGGGLQDGLGGVDVEADVEARGSGSVTAVASFGAMGAGGGAAGTGAGAGDDVPGAGAGRALGVGVVCSSSSSTSQGVAEK